MQTSKIPPSTRTAAGKRWRLIADTRGNTLALCAAALVPIMGAVGAGIDIARAHLVKGKLQEAVDSAALAGRRAMVRDDIATAKSQVDSFLAFNFHSGSFDTTPVRTNLTKPDVGTVRVTAQTEVRTIIMGLFGIRTIAVLVSSEATQNFDNLDIMLVLDTTGSMTEMLGGRRRIDALRDAVKALYAELAPAQAQLAAQGLRIRYGIVPYAATVNVGKLLHARNPNYLQTSNVSYWHFRAERSLFWTNWVFGERTYDLSHYVAGGPLGNINNNGNFSTARWAGCIEERSTVRTILTGMTGAIPAGAHDLDIDGLPTGDATRWRPYVFDPRYGDPNTYCPSEATPLSVMSAAQIEAKVNALVAQGSTYHDVGMIWGTRMISNAGVFGAENPNRFGNRPVNRYIIYMTDGEMSAPVQANAYSQYYSAYGTEAYDRRTGATSTNDNNGRHTARFLMACDEAKARGVSVWTIAFGTGHVPSLERCASNADQAAVADDSQALIDKFSDIGRNIGPLRLSK